MKAVGAAPNRAHLGEHGADSPDVALVFQRTQILHAVRRLGADGRNAKPFRMQETEAWRRPGKLFKESPNAEIISPHVGVMEENHAPLGEFGAPLFKVVLDRLVRMIAVYVENIDRVIGELQARFVKGHAQQFRKSRIGRIVEGLQLIVDLAVVKAGLRVALPGVDRVEPGVQAQARDGFAKCRIGHAMLRSQFDHQARLACSDDPESKRNVTPPGAWLIETGRRPEQRLKILEEDRVELRRRPLIVRHVRFPSRVRRRSDKKGRQREPSLAACLCRGLNR